MNLLPIVGGILIGALAYAVCFHGVASRGRVDASRHGQVAAICLVAVAFSVMMILTLHETSVSALLLWNRIGLGLSALVFPLMLTYYDHLRRTLSRRTRRAIWAISLLLIVANVLLPQGVQFVHVAGLQWHSLPWGERYATLHGALHPLFGIAAAWILALTVLAALIQAGNYRHTRQASELVLLAGIVVYLLAVVLGLLSRIGYLNLHFAGVYGLALMVLSISLVHVHDDRRGREREALEKQHHRERLDWLARHDALTGLPNRAALDDALQNAVLAPGSVLALLDVDRLGRINEAFGHDTGDTLLQALARRLQERLAPRDRLSRIGGQLCVLLDGAEALARLRELQNATRAPFELANGLVVELDVSAGYTSVQGRCDLAASLQQAESALHAAGPTALSGLFAFDASQFQRSRRWTQVGSRLRSALQRGEFRLVYQPRVYLDDGRHAGFEALLRWRGADGEIEPGEFVRIAEESGFIAELGEHVLELALAQLREWQTVGLAHGRLAVNLSMRQLTDVQLPERLAAALAAQQLSPSLLDLEITETAAMEHADQVLPQLLTLAAAGHTLAIDDFGTGYSSLARLQELPCAVIKIDLGFVRRLGTPGGEELMRGLLGLVRDLGRSAVAEGVETAAQCDWLRAAGCHEAQGYWFARPLEVAAATAWLQLRAKAPAPEAID